MTMADVEFIQTEEFNTEQIARIFKVPPHLIGHLKRSTNNNIEQQSLEFVTHSLLPYVKNLEETFNDAFLDNDDSYFFKFNVNALLRSDLKSRTEAYSISVQNGFMTRNEVRQLEDRNTDPSLDDFTIQLNMTTAEKMGQQEDQDPPQQDPAPIEEVKAALMPLLTRSVRQGLSAARKNKDRDKAEVNFYNEVIASVHALNILSRNLDRDEVKKSLKNILTALTFEESEDDVVKLIIGSWEK